MKVFFIRNDADRSIWARNRWGSPIAAPDLYKTYAAAERQIKQGKISLMQRFAEPGELLPVIVEARLTARN